jgi:hypothetical protein
VRLICQQNIPKNRRVMMTVFGVFDEEHWESLERTLLSQDQACLLRGAKEKRGQDFSGFLFPGP